MTGSIAYRCSAALILVLAAQLQAVAGPAVDVVVGGNAPQLEKFAAKELSDLFQTLFEADVAVVTSAKSNDRHRILLGSPSTNPAVRTATGKNWPRLSGQGQLLRSIKLDGRDALIVGGGSPVATLWGVYELGHRLGMRYSVHGDQVPAVQPEFALSGYDAQLEPQQKIRIWRTVNDFAIGPESWGLAEQKRMLRQAAKLKFNRVMLAVYPWQPFVDYEFRGVKKQTATLFFGETYRVDGDTPGRPAFKGKVYFTNPDFADANTPEEMTAVGKTFLTGIIDEAHALGMTAGISISPLEFPKEFAEVLPGAPKPHGLKQLVIGPGPQQTPDDPLFQELVKTKIRAYLTTYPTIDQLYLTLPEFPDWVAHSEKSWSTLSAKYKLGDYNKVVASARDRKIIASGDRGENSVRGNITALDFFHKLRGDAGLFKNPAGQAVQLVISNLDPALFSAADRLIPVDVEMLHFVDYTARRVVANKHLLATLPSSAAKRSTIILTLADDNVGVLPQLATSDIHALLAETRKLGWAGYSTRYWFIGDLDPTLHYLARASFDASVTPTAAYDDLFNGICGPGVAQRTTEAFQYIEQATALIDDHDLGFAFPVPGMIMKHYTSDLVPQWWGEVAELYTNAMNEMYRGQTRAGKEGRNYILYHAKRHEYALFYVTAITSLRAAAQAKKMGDLDKAVEEMENAVVGVFDATNCIGEVAASNSDRGLIAIMTAYGYRPVMAEFERLIEAADQ